jgi:hypothetical protein
MMKPVTNDKPPAVKSAKGAKNKIQAAIEIESEDAGGDFYELQYPVIKMIEAYMAKPPNGGKKLTVKAFAEIAGVPFANLTGIINGHRWLARCSRDFIEKLANTLEIPVLQIYTMSGFITAKDVVATQSLDKVLDAIHATMLADQAVSYRVPGYKAWDEWPIDAKLCLCMMYEAYTGKRLQQYAAIHVKA